MKKLLVAGYMRSGSTFLANILNSQKNIRVYRDFLNCLFRDTLNIGVNNYTMLLSDRQRSFLLSRLKNEAHYMKQYFFDSLKPDDFKTLGELYNLALKCMVPDVDCKVVGSKVTSVGSWLQRVVDETDIYIIYLYRDIRDILLSSRNFFASYNVVRFIYNIKQDIKQALKINSFRIFRLKFENLIFEPHYWLGELSHFLDVDIKPLFKKALDIDTGGWVDNSSFHDINQLFDKGACYRWKNYTESVEVKYSEILARGLLTDLDYEIMFNGCRWSDKLVANLKYLGCGLLHNQNIVDMKNKLLNRWGSIN